MKTHEDLNVWQKSINLVIKIYSIIDKLIENKKYELSKRMRRAAVLIPSNIAEGAARSSDIEFLKFLYYSLESLSELETQLIVTEKLELLDNNSINPELNKIRQMILGLIRFLKNRLKN